MAHDRVVGMVVVIEPPISGLSKGITPLGSLPLEALGWVVEALGVHQITCPPVVLRAPHSGHLKHPMVDFHQVHEPHAGLRHERGAGEWLYLLSTRASEIRGGTSGSPKTSSRCLCSSYQGFSLNRLSVVTVLS